MEISEEYLSRECVKERSNSESQGLEEESTGSGTRTCPWKETGEQRRRVRR